MCANKQRLRVVAFFVAMMLSWLVATPGQAVVHEKGYGEPYDPAGKRIVFTTWYWVRPGQMDWQDDSGRSVFANKSVMAGPFDAHFVNIDGPWGVRLVAERAQRGGKLEIKPEYPWEAKDITITQLLPTPEGKIMAWGTCTGEDGQTRNCYLESTDGMTWIRPNLGLVEYNGSRQNNLTPGGPSGHVFIDPTAPPQERFKSASNSDLKLNQPEDQARFEAYKKRRPIQQMALETDPGRAHAIFGFVSPDGIQWKRLDDPLSVEVSDGDQSVYWDADIKKYVMYARTYFVGPRADGYPLKHERRHQFIGRRAIGRSEASDFREFGLSEVVIDTRNDMAPTDTFYLNCYTRIPGMGRSHLMFVSRYIQAEDKTAIDLYTSYDGKSWHEAPGSPLLETNKFGQWDGGDIFAYPNLIERGDGDWLLLYRGDNFPHKYPRGKQASAWGTAVWPQGRLMAIEAPLEGFFATPAFLLPGQKLRINALTSRVGEIRVEVADFYGKTIPGRSFADCNPIIGDQYRTPVTWKNGDSIGLPLNEPVVLRFKMSRAKIYSLDFE
ncbi:hypothetical protein [Fontivita pretiosa]|uniref:hypothetical protein n=1 Tax=Fontivita pretiosa TaxID=2989684 RepID=UPI003D16DF07